MTRISKHEIERRLEKIDRDTETDLARYGFEVVYSSTDGEKPYEIIGGSDDIEA